MFHKKKHDPFSNSRVRNKNIKDNGLYDFSVLKHKRLGRKRNHEIKSIKSMCKLTAVLIANLPLMSTFKMAVLLATTSLREEMAAIHKSAVSSLQSDIQRGIHIKGNEVFHLSGASTVMTFLASKKRDF